MIKAFISYPSIPTTNPKHYTLFATHLSHSHDVIALFSQYEKSCIIALFKMKKKCHCYVSKKHVMYRKEKIQKEGIMVKKRENKWRKNEKRLKSKN